MLKVSALSFAFAQRKLFTDVSFSLLPGAIMHLQGSNGVGKSTLLMVIAGLHTASAGSVAWQGGSAETVPADRRQLFAYLSAEANGLYLRMDAKDNLLFWAHLRGVPLTPEEAFTLLLHWGLGHRLLRQDFPVGQFSTGMRRRLALARVSLSAAPCWLLDEPLFGLDRKGIALFQELLAEHSRRGGVAIIVSHDEAPLAALISHRYDLMPSSNVSQR